MRSRRGGSAHKMLGRGGFNGRYSTAGSLSGPRESQTALVAFLTTRRPAWKFDILVQHAVHLTPPAGTRDPRKPFLAADLPVVQEFSV